MAELSVEGVRLLLLLLRWWMGMWYAVGGGGGGGGQTRYVYVAGVVRRTTW